MPKTIRADIIDREDERRLDRFFSRAKLKGGECGLLLVATAQDLGAKNIPVLDADTMYLWFEVINMMCTPDGRLRRESSLKKFREARRAEVKAIADKLEKQGEPSPFDVLNNIR